MDILCGAMEPKNSDLVTSFMAWVSVQPAGEVVGQHEPGGGEHAAEGEGDELHPRSFPLLQQQAFLTCDYRLRVLEGTK